MATNLKVVILKNPFIHCTVEKITHVCRIEFFPPKINVICQLYQLYHVFSIYIGHFMQIFEAEDMASFLANKKNFLRKQPFDRFQTFFKDILCLEQLTNLDKKGSKRSVNFFKKYFVLNEWPAVKKCSVHAYRFNQNKPSGV